MRIIILTIGSRGDVQPYVALGRGLERAGHDVTLAATDEFRDFVTGAGLRFEGLGGDMRALFASEAGQRWLAAGDNIFRYLRTMREMVEPSLEVWRDRADALVRDQDAVLFHPSVTFGAFSAEAAGIPAICLPLMPWCAAPDIEPMAFAKVPRIARGFFNRFLGHLSHVLISLPFRGFHNRHRRALGLGPMRGWSQHHHVMAERVPHVKLYSDNLVKSSAYWPDFVEATGFCFLDAGQHRPDPALARFLAAGEAPVYVGFGSATSGDPAEMGRVVLDAVERVGCRAVLATGWGGLNAEASSDRVHVIEGAPHEWLFPRCAAVAHAGGIGTTAAGLRAGRPTVIIPFVGDQPYWGRQMVKQGVGPEPVPRQGIDAERLAAAIQQAITDPGIAARAAAMGEAIRREDGVGRAVEVIEGHLARMGAPRRAPARIARVAA